VKGENAMANAKPQITMEEKVAILSRELWNAILAIEKLQRENEILKDKLNLLQEHFDILKKKIGN
jgi:FtsZ-binding cell division protein ZapB